MYAGDTLPGHPPIPIDGARRRARAGILAGLIGTVIGLLAGTVRLARTRPDVLGDVAGAALVVGGVAVLWGGGWALLAAGVAVLAVNEFHGPTRPDGP